MSYPSAEPAPSKDESPSLPDTELASSNELRRGLSTGSALGLNVIDMVGVGPFVTLPLIVAVMGGPQAILGWIMGALLSLCDGLIWSELGTAYPEAGGSYAYLKHLYGERTLGRAFSFLYAWHLLISAPLSIASGWIGSTHFDAHRAFDFPAGAFHLNRAFFVGLGAGMLISAYDYWGYYNVCFLGAEVRDPQRTMPRAVLGAIGVVGTLYLLMNVSVLGVLPWREMAQNTDSHARMFTMAVFMERLYGHTAAGGVVVLIALAALASGFALLLGYSRIPFAAARDGSFPAWFGVLHPKHRIPMHSLLTLGGVTLLCCIFRLQDVITTLVVIRILFQFLLQGASSLPT